jgi:hypothetical protein
MAVVDPSGYRLGEVVGLVIDTDEQRARLLNVLWGGVLGLSRCERLVPIEVVSKVDDRVHVARNHADLPAVSPALFDGASARHRSLLTDLSVIADVYGHFGVPPFWTVDRPPAYFHTRGDQRP